MTSRAAAEIELASILQEFACPRAGIERWSIMMGTPVTNPSASSDALIALRDAVGFAVPRIKQLKGSYWPQHGTTGDLNEANYLAHVAEGLRRGGATVYHEVPGSAKQVRVDVLALHSEQGWALVIEGKCLLSQGNDKGVAGDVAKLESLRLRRSSGSIVVSRLRCHTALLLSTWREDYANWWAATSARPSTPGVVYRPENWARIGKYLSACPPDAVRSVNVRTAAKHWLLYAVRPEPTVGAFWA